MVSRRGLPTDVLSDNRTNFIGAKNELEELASLDREKIQEKTASYGVKWHFNPPLAPHFSPQGDDKSDKESHLCYSKVC